MATKSFQTEFTFNQKTGRKLAIALDGSRKTDINLSKPVEFLTNKNDKKKINDIIKDFD
ncbi:hypothetical protein [Companilactobacillus nantensis]|uniref:Uncharacterized protein n=1 Tax=Companilactobacillus nantensis DSM 16982 TaxID=1423774 RepID=A0A0R1WC06_9LACO|nr:hypothetical protein [Companilactobacillus nantensis]KRM15383.1 hypothetical protein FD31_GL001236 [Companilactobacillus nantensis DSM 16982]GEO65045.1 hypothetical protein LNA01_22280 [Companilactobacillus nantensis]